MVVEFRFKVNIDLKLHANTFGFVYAFFRPLRSAMSSPALLQATMSSVRKRGTLILGNLQKNIHKIEENAKRIYVKIKPFLPQFMSRPWWSMYDHLVYNLNILVPDHDPEKILKVDGYFIQAVHIGRKVLWRSVKDEYARLNDHMRGKLASRNIEKYVVIQENEKFLPVLDPHSSFQKRWDIVMLVLLGFTALVIPFETAYVVQFTLTHACSQLDSSNPNQSIFCSWSTFWSTYCL